MISRTWRMATPASGGSVRGVVVDHAGRPVAGALVRLGPYAALTVSDGTYAFVRVPPADYALTLDPHALPASYAWDGRGRTLRVTRRTDGHHTLLVTPLNAIHGRVYVDTNANGTWDTDEGVAGAVVRCGADRVAATDETGAYSFYNVWPGAHDLSLGPLPAGLAAHGASTRAVTLSDTAPVRGADFVVARIVRPTVWQEMRR
jgi:hypothetical protein